MRLAAQPNERLDRDAPVEFNFQGDRVAGFGIGATSAGVLRGHCTDVTPAPNGGLAELRDLQ